MKITKISFDLDGTSSKDLSLALKLNAEQRKREYKRIVAYAAVDFASYVKKTVLSGQLVKVRTGHLRNSFGNTLDPEGVLKKSLWDGDYFAEIGTRVPYAHTLEYGAKIAPRIPNGALAIPLGGALTPAGAPRFTWRKRGDIPAQFPDLFMIRSKKGNALLVRKEGNRIVPMFVLKRVVNITDRRWLHKAAQAYGRRFMQIVYKGLEGKL